MTELPSSPPHSITLLPPAASAESPSLFDPSRAIGIIKRKALIKDLAAVYHAECLAYCQELLQLQQKCEEPCADIKVAADSRKETMKPPNDSRNHASKFLSTNQQKMNACFGMAKWNQTQPPQSTS